MPNSFLNTLFQHRARCNRELVSALRGVSAEIDPVQLGIMLMTVKVRGAPDMVTTFLRQRNREGRT